jgi:hypothetical protein
LPHASLFLPTTNVKSSISTPTYHNVPSMHSINPVVIHPPITCPNNLPPLRPSIHTLLALSSSFIVVIMCLVCYFPPPTEHISFQYAHSPITVSSLQTVSYVFFMTFPPAHFSMFSLQTFPDVLSSFFPICKIAAIFFYLVNKFSFSPTSYCPLKPLNDRLSRLRESPSKKAAM